MEDDLDALLDGMEQQAATLTEPWDAAADLLGSPDAA